jgi:hypothetical protein
MQNPLFLILIVRRNRDYFSEDLTQSLSNENGKTDRKRAEITNFDNPKPAPYPGNDSHSDNGQQGNVYLKPEKRK